MAEDVFSREFHRIMMALSTDDVKVLEWFLCLRYPPWTTSEDQDAGFVFQQMKQKLVWSLDPESRTCNFKKLVECMKVIQRDDLGQRLCDLGEAKICLSVIVHCSRTKTANIIN